MGEEGRGGEGGGGGGGEGRGGEGGSGGEGRAVAGVLACSALKRSYRDILLGRGTKTGVCASVCTPVMLYCVLMCEGCACVIWVCLFLVDISSAAVLVYLHGPESVIRQRMARRGHHFMAPSLLRSQLQLLEVPSSEEAPTLSCSVLLSVSDIVSSVCASLATWDSLQLGSN